MKIWKVEITEITTAIVRGFEPGWYARVHQHGGATAMIGPLAGLWEVCSVLGGLEPARPHAQDADCTVVDGECTGCGVWHGMPCEVCGGRAFHRETCDAPGAILLRQAVAADRTDDTQQPSPRDCPLCDLPLPPSKPNPAADLPRRRHPSLEQTRMTRRKKPGTPIAVPPPMNTTTKTVTTDCGRCAGSGRYYFSGGSDVCYGCNGRGKRTVSAAQHARIQAEKVRMAATWEKYCADETARETAEDRAYGEALEVIATDGIAGARNYFRANRTDRNALAGLIAAMRESGLTEESNAVVRFRNAMR